MTTIVYRYLGGLALILGVLTGAYKLGYTDGKEDAEYRAQKAREEAKELAEQAEQAMLARLTQAERAAAEAATHTRIVYEPIEKEVIRYVEKQSQVAVCPAPDLDAEWVRLHDRTARPGDARPAGGTDAAPAPVVGAGASG